MSSAQPSLMWNLRQSLWLLVPLGTFGFLGGAALLVVGSRAGRPLWWILGLVHLTLTAVAIALVGGTGVQEEIATWLLLACWLAGSSFALAINPEYLRFKWDRDRGAARPSRTTGSTTRARSGSQLNSRGRSRNRSGANSPRSAPRGRAGSRNGAPAPGAGAYGESRAPRPGAPGPAGVPARQGAAPASSQATAAAAFEPVDVNAATAREFETLPGFSRALAKKAVQVREERGGFTSEQDFAAALDLPPHVFQRLRGRIACRRRPQAPPSFGRVVDY